MIDTYPNPWDFNNSNKELFSDESLYRVAYYNLKEIAMGAPIGGKCFLEHPEKNNIKIHDWCGGPPAWQSKGRLVAIPIWIKHFPKGTIQRLGIVDTKFLELKIYSKIFSVLDLKSFEKTTVYGYDSPIHNTSILTFEIDKEKVDTTIKLTE